MILQSVFFDYCNLTLFTNSNVIQTCLICKETMHNGSVFTETYL